MGQPNMYVVVDRYVKPRTRNNGTGFALTVNPRGLHINLFVIHTWAATFADFLAGLRGAVETGDALWVCSFAIDQNKAKTVEQSNGDAMSQSYFAKALRYAHKVVVVMDTNNELMKRTWCTYEIAMAACWNVPIALWFHEPPNIEEF